MQGTGIGKAMLGFAEQKAKEQGYHEVAVWAFKGNHKAVSFNQKYGYCMDKEEYLGEPYASMQKLISVW